MTVSESAGGAVAPRPARAQADDAELSRLAAGGEQAAFEELYRRHGHVAWRFAQAVCAGRADAQDATADAFTRVLRLARRGRTAAAEQFGPYVLAAVYRHALDVIRANGQPGGTTARVDPEVPNGGALIQGFRALPERWRAVLWLSDVEDMTVAAVAPILGVSTPVAAQMATRARGGLVNRYRQAGAQDNLPPIADVLKTAALAMPAGLRAAAVNRWKKAMTSERRHVVPAAGWLTERAPRPLLTCAAGLLAMGLIGLGVLGERGGLGSLTPGGPPAVPLATHEFNGPRGGSLNLAAAILPFGDAASFAGTLTGVGGFIQGITFTSASAALAGAGPAGAGGAGSPILTPSTSRGGTGTPPSGSQPPGAQVPGVPVTLPGLPPGTLPPVALPPVPPPVTVPKPPVTLPPPPATLPKPPVTLPPPPATLPPPPTTLPTIP